jgi:hypothetical protein
VISWHIPSVNEFDKFKVKEFKQHDNIDKKYVSVSLNLGKFLKCGFYDWKLACI